MARFIRLTIVISIVLFFVQFAISKSYAASLTGLSDTITTSRPSASSPLVNNATGSDIQETIFDNKSVFLASDSATFQADTGETQDTGVNVASMSATAVPSSGQRVVYFTGTVGHTHHQGDAVYTPITAMHTVTLKPIASIPVNGKIIISFPALAASDSTPASPSASGFQFNGLSTSNVKVNFSSGSSTCSLAITGTGAGGTPTITCTVATASVTGGGSVTVTVLIGCSANSGASCTTQVPTLINPTKTAAAGTADIWKVSLQTQDNNSVVLDSGKASIGTIESVQVQAQVDPTLTFTIAGINTGVNINSGHGASCPSESTNTGINSTVNFVNLGVVSTAAINIAAQDLTVATNGTGGYSLTATSSGQLQNPASGYAINSSTSFATMTAGTEYYGIHACGTDANANFVPASAVSGGGGGKVAWPTPTTSISVASRSTVSTGTVTTVEYAATASGTTPAGIYTTVITYVATPTFN